MKRPPLHRLLIGLAIASAVVASVVPAVALAKGLVVYSARNEQLIKPVFDLYTKETGVDVKFTTADAAVLVTRLAAEGRNSPADILMTVDAGELWNAAERGLLKPLRSPVLEKNVPKHLRDPQGRVVRLLAARADHRLQPAQGRPQVAQHVRGARRPGVEGPPVPAHLEEGL